MYLGENKIKTVHKRVSKKGLIHTYERLSTIVDLRCDSCDKRFQRPRKNMDPNRLNNNCFHVCGNCDAKRFAQKRGVERRNMWSLTASSSLPISKL
jgi:hypothetical protein